MSQSDEGVDSTAQRLSGEAWNLSVLLADSELTEAESAAVLTSLLQLSDSLALAFASIARHSELHRAGVSPSGVVVGRMSPRLRVAAELCGAVRGVVDPVGGLLVEGDDRCG
jgi:hypothetical protein